MGILNTMISWKKLKGKIKNKERKYTAHEIGSYFASTINAIKNMVTSTSLGDTNLEFLNQLDTYDLALMNPTVTACINAKCEKIMGLRWEIKPNNPEQINESEEEFLTDLFNNPHGITDTTNFNDYLLSWVKNYELTGNAFVEVQYNSKGFSTQNLSDISALNIIDTAEIEYDTTRNQFCLKNNHSVVFDQFHLLQSKNRDVFHPQEVFGYSKLHAINKQLKVMLIGLEYNSKTLVNGGINPRTVFSYPVDMSRDDFIEELAYFNKMSEKANEEGKKHTIAMKGVEVQTTGVTNSDMEFKDMYSQSVQDICACLGVPPSIIGVNIGTHNNNAYADRFIFNEKINNLINIFTQVHNNLLKNLGYSYHIEFEKLDTKDLKSESEMFDTYLWNGVLTPNDVRDHLGLAPVSWGDVPFNNNYNKNNRKGKNFDTLQKDVDVDVDVDDGA